MSKIIDKLGQKWILVIGFLLIALIPRLYRWDRLLGDWHSWRQVDTASVTQNYLSSGIDLLHPTYHDLSNIPSGLPNPEGHRMVEFPYINALIAVTYNLTGGLGLSLHVFSRLWSIGFSLLAVAFFFFTLDRLLPRSATIWATLVFALLPFNLFFHTTVLPEIPLLALTITSWYWWIRYVDEQKNLWLVVFACCAAAALLLKPIYVFVGPALIYYLIKQQGWVGLKRLYLYLAAAAILMPFFGWRWWIQQFPAGIPASDWLFNGNNIRFKGAFFRWIFADRIGRLILGYWGLIPFGVGLILKPSRQAGWFFHWLLVGMLAYLTVFATGNVTHDYYQIFIVPSLAIFVGLGLNHLFQAQNHRYSHFVSRLLMLTSSLFMLAFGWFGVRDNFNINNPALEAVYQEVPQMLPNEARVIAPYQGDTALLYQTKRPGWPIGFEIAEKIDQGATHYLSTAYDDETQTLEQACSVIHKTELYTLIDLRNCPGI